MNAIAYSESSGYIDPFGGISDIKRRTVRCVGNAEERFNEDRLRVLRAIRFSSELGFELHEDTAKAVHAYANRLDGLSKERISSELCRLLCGERVFRHNGIGHAEGECIEEDAARRSRLYVRRHTVVI